MATLSHADSRRMYSWWWNSHISPKNSKWLHENLADMDAKVKSMIKLIEEDADSFARRAEMYYKKRPELMKLVEEFYRAYRALAERYDHATGALRQAHRTMAEAFPNQIPLLPDDSPATSSEADPHTPEMSTPTRAWFDPDDLQKDALGLSSSHFYVGKRNGELSEKSDSILGQKGLKQFNDLFGSGGLAKFSEGRVRKGLNFNEAEEKEESVQSNENPTFQTQALFESEQAVKTDKEIIILKEVLVKLEAEKEAGLIQYQQSLERLATLESEVFRAQEEFRELTDRTSKAEAEAQTLKEARSRVEAEKEEGLLLYQQCLDRISNLENVLSHAQEDTRELNERGRKAETETQILKRDLSKLEAEKEAALDQYNLSLEMISDLEKKFLHAEEDVRKFSERAEKAESEVETLKQAIAKLTEEKEAEALLHKQCLETLSSLEHKLSLAQAEAERLNGEIDNGVAKLKNADEQCLTLERSNQTLQFELESLVLKMSTQSQELTEKDKELGRLWTCLQEERFRFVEAETAFQTLQHLHSQVQEELRTLASELQNRTQTMRDVEARNQGLRDEILKHKEENKNLNELSLSSAISMKDMQNEIFGLKESNGKLEEEVELRMDQRNALQQEIYCLKEELNELNKKHRAILEQVDTVGLNPDCFGSSVKELQDQNANLKEDCQRERCDRLALLAKLEIMGQLLEKNAVLENSLSDLGAELEGVRGKIKALEESCQSLVEEKSTLTEEKADLLNHLQSTTENLGKLSEKNTVLENSLSDAHVELELLKVKSKSLEDSCQLLVNEKAVLISEKGTLVSQMEISQKSMKDLEILYTDLEEKYSALEKARESTLRKVEEIEVSLAVQKQEHVSFTQMNELQLSRMKSQIHLLQEESRDRRKEFEEELDKALDSQIEIFVLLSCVQDLEEKNFSLLNDCQKLLKASKLSEKLIYELEQENVESQVKVKSISDHISTLRIGMHRLLKVFEIVSDHGCEDNIEQDQSCLNSILSKVEDTKHTLIEIQDENRQMTVEMLVLMTLLGQLRTEAENLEIEKYMIDQELSVMAKKFLGLQSESYRLLETNEELRLKVSKGDHKAEVLISQKEDLRWELLDVQGAYRNLQMETSEVLEEKRSLMKELLHKEERIHTVEEENCMILDEVICQTNLSLIFKNYIDEKSVEINGLGEDLKKLYSVNGALEKKLSIVERKLEEVQMENLHFKETLQKSEHDLETVILLREQLNCEIRNGKNLLHLKEREFTEAEQKLKFLENEKNELCKIVTDLKRENDDIKMTTKEQGKQILELSEDNDRLSKEQMCLRETSQMLECELHQLREEHGNTKNREESLCSELQKRKGEVELLETQAASIYCELQTSTICQALFGEKVHELTEVCVSLQEENTSKDMDIELLKERVSSFEDENGCLKVQLGTYGPSLISLRDCISSLENSIYLQTKLQKSNNEETKGTELVNEQHVKSNLHEDKNVVGPDAFLDLQSRVKAIENAVIEMERLLMQENLDAHSKLEAVMCQMEELKSQRSSRRRNTKTSEISEAEIGLLTKDIMLDQASECSSHGISKREQFEGENQMLELWEAADQDGSIDMNVGKTRKVVNQQNEYQTSDFLVEKEFSVDKLQISKRFKEPREEGNNRKVLERLNSDVQKLTNLQITVQDLKKKVEIMEKSKKGKAIVECETLKGQLEEAEEAILKLFDLNGKVMKNLEDSSFSTEKKSTVDSKESGGVRRKRISEQAQRASEKIGRLQLEVQKIQFVLLKLDDEKEIKGRSRILETNRSVRLKDYLYGGGRTNPRRKKASYCACIEPPTKGD